MDPGIKIWPLPQRIRTSMQEQPDEHTTTHTHSHTHIHSHTHPHNSEGPKKEKCLDQSSQMSNQRKSVIPNRQEENKRQMKNAGMREREEERETHRQHINTGA